MTIFSAAFAAFNFGKYFGAFEGLLFTSLLAVVGVVVIRLFVVGDTSEARGKAP
ncbi:hypothetical protein [Arthrobacter psychrolactophilus]